MSPPAYIRWATLRHILFLRTNLLEIVKRLSLECARKFRYLLRGLSFYIHDQQSALLRAISSQYLSVLPTCLHILKLVNHLHSIRISIAIPPYIFFWELYPLHRNERG